MKKYFIVVLISSLLITSCAVLQTITNVSRLKFKLNSIENFKVDGISITKKTKLSDFNTMDVINLTSKFATGKLPVSFNVNVAANNPNDGKGGYPATDITLKSFEWQLFINNKETIAGNISQPILVPGVGESTIIKLQMDMDLLKFFKDGGLNEVINLALKLGGEKGSTSNIKLVAKPVIGTIIGDIAYPDPITIVDTNFN